MKFSTRLAAGALVASMAAVPATADAKPVSASSVKAQLRTADLALDRVVTLVRSNRDGAAAKQLRVYRRNVRAAKRGVRRLSGSTVTVRSTKSFASVAKLLGSVANQCADSLSQVVDEASGSTQVGIAEAIEACLITRQQVVDLLTELLDKVPEAARPHLAQVIAWLSSDGEDEVGHLTEVLTDPTLPHEVAGSLTHALELATAAIDDAIALLQGIVPTLPPMVQPIVSGVLEMVRGQLASVTTMIHDLLGQLLGMVPGGQAGGGETGGGPPGLGLLQGIFGPGFPFNLIPINLPFDIPGFTAAVR